MRQTTPARTRARKTAARYGQLPFGLVTFALPPFLGVQVGVEVSLEPDPRDDLFRLSGRKAEIERHRRPSDALAEGDRPAYMGVALRTI